MDQNTLVRTLVAERVKTLGYINFLVRREDLAEDIFQDICALAVERCESIKDEQHLLGWLRTTARFQSMNARRSARDKQVAFDDNLIELLESDWQEQDAFKSEECIAALDHCVGRLSKKARELVHKRYYRHVEYSQLAKELGRPLNSLYVSFSRIHALLAQCITARLSQG
jgi:RNA polymerase sigma-70 factor (ECF subfamily)